MTQKQFDNDNIARFRDWEFHFSEDALYNAKDANELELVPLENICRKTLAFFIKNPDRVISREELLEKVWNVTNVTDVRIARVISLLRSALGDDANNPIYILTIPKSGYKFIGFNSETVKNDSQYWLRYQKRVIVAALSFCVLAFAGFMFWGLLGQQKAMKSYTMHESVGNAMDFNLSPNSQLLAFVSESEIDPMAVNKDLGGNLTIKNFATSETMVVKKKPDIGAIVGPVWHPLERKIAYRVVEPSSFCEIRIATLSENFSTIIDESQPIECSKEFTFLGKMAWSFDGKHLIYPDFSHVTENIGIYRVNVETGVKDQLTSPPANSLGDYYISASKTKNELAFLRDDSKTLSQLWLLDLNTFEQSRVYAFENSVYPHFVEWLPDESGFVYQGIQNAFIAIDRVTKNKEQFGEFVAKVQSIQFCNTGKIFAASFSGQQYATGKSSNPFLSNSFQFNIHTKNPYYFVNPMKDLPDAFFSAPESVLELWIDYKDGRKRKVETFDSNHFNAKAIFSNDGKQLIAVVGDSVWISRLDGVKEQLNKPSQILVNPSWSANQREVFGIVPADNWSLISIDIQTKEQKTIGHSYSFFQQSPDGNFEVFIKTNSDEVMIRNVKTAATYPIAVTNFDRTKSIRASFVNDHLYVKCSRCSMEGFPSSQVIVRHDLKTNQTETKSLSVFGDDRDFHVTTDEQELYFDVKEKHRKYSLNVISPK